MDEIRRERGLSAFQVKMDDSNNSPESRDRNELYGEILLQQRSHKKVIYPLLWDVSVAGHIDAGETYIDAALRETEEEIGLQLIPESLIKIGAILHESLYNNGSIQDNEFHQVYISELKVPLKQLVPQETEVEALKLVTFDTFEALLEQSESNSHFIATNKSYYKFVLLLRVSLLIYYNFSSL